MVKPRLRASSVRWLWEVWQYVEEYDSWRHDDFLRQAPADVFDGWCIPSELADLVRRRILTVIPVRKEDQNGISPVTWFFTDRGMAIMRAWKAGAPATAVDLEEDACCCPNCGTPLHGAAGGAEGARQ